MTVLKPLKGLDDDTAACLTSFIRQDYPDQQILFGVADPADPVLPVLQALKEQHPGLDLQIVICPWSWG